MSETVTDFELRVLKAIGKGALVSGNCMVAYSAAARRLERKGFVGKGNRWFVTAAGHLVLMTPAAPASKE